MKAAPILLIKIYKINFDAIGEFEFFYYCENGFSNMIFIFAYS